MNSPSSRPVQGAAKRGMPLVLLIGAAILWLVILATGIVGISAYRSSSQSIDAMWSDLAIQLSERTTEVTLRHFEPAVPFAHTSQRLLAAGRLDVDDPEGLLEYLEAVLDSNPTITWASFAGMDARYLSVYRWPLLGRGVEIRRSHRVMDPPGPDGAQHTWYRDDKRMPSGEWVRIRDDHKEQYDPRPKVWYKATRDSPRGRGNWVGPSLMHSRRQLAVFYALPAFDSAGTRKGIWLAEFEAGPLTEFLATVDVGVGTRVYIVDSNGMIVAHPDAHFVKEVGGKPEPLPASEDTDPLLTSAWAGLQERSQVGDEPIYTDDVLVMARRFPEESGIPWTVITAVPAEELFGEARAQARFSALVGVIAIVIAILLGLFLSRKLGSAFGAVKVEMQRIARFELSDERLADRKSIVREVNEIADTADTMKSGLRSFGKYAPRSVVAQVLKSGGEAELGAEPREVSVLFTDIASFTSFLELLPPWDIVRRLGDYLQTLDEAIEETGGLRLQYLGDGIMAMWGAPVTQEDHALKACRAMLAMRSRLTEQRQKSAYSGTPAFRTRFGLNSGVSLVGNIGAAERFSYTCVGDPVNIASRLEGMNKVYGTQLIIGERTAELVGEELVLRPLDRVRVKGKKRNVLVHELIGETGSVRAHVLEAIKIYTRALSRYQAGHFDKALAGFEAAQATLRVDDGPCRVMAERCHNFLEAPPPEDWDGVATMTSK